MKSIELKHVALIMDGNGRWANSRMKPRSWGHIRGSFIVSDIIEAADEIGIKSLTLYAFSTENWSRPVEEIRLLFKLLKKFIVREKRRIINNNIVFKMIGDRSELPQQTVDLINELELQTKHNSGLNLTFAFSYGGRKEIISAVNKCQIEYPGQKITEEMISENLYRPEVGDVDLLIRTGGEQRVSNFLLWQLAYSELYFSPTKWPEFSKEEFKNIVLNVKSRERRFGGLTQNSNLVNSSKVAHLHRSRFSVEAQ